MISDRLARVQRKFAKDYHTYNRIELSRSALLGNYYLIQKHHPKSSIIPVLKANAYGHGLEEIAEILKERDFPYIAVDGYFEALAIRAVSKQPVLIMGAIDPRNFQNMRYEHFAFVVHDRATIQALGKTKKQINVHLELDTGMRRQGIPLQDLDEYLTLIGTFPGLKLEGIMSHLADADGHTDRFTVAQTEAFDKAVARARELGYTPQHLHLGQSAGSVTSDSRTANAFRIGLALYGINPFAKKDPRHSVLEEIRPVLSLKSTLIKVHQLGKGDRVSYNGIFVAPKPMQLGVLPLGYYEGVRRALSNRGVVTYLDEYLPIVGRVCMNHTMVNLGESDAGTGEEVTVISSNAADRNSVESICREFDLFSYELLVTLAPTIRRTIID